MGLNRSERLLLFIGGVGVTVFLAYFFFYKDSNYVIPNVPAFTLFSEEALNNYYPRNHSGVLAVASLLKYWGAPINLNSIVDKSELALIFTDPTSSESRQQYWRDYMDRKGFSFEAKIIPDVNSLRKYINSRTRTPLILRVPYNLDYPTIFSYMVLVGVKDDGNKLVVHSYTDGNNVEIPLEEYQKMWAAYPYPQSRYLYYIIQPKDINDRLKRMPKSGEYATRPDFVEKLKHLMPELLLSTRGDLKPDERIKHFEKIVTDPQYELFHPAYKVSILSAWAYTLLSSNKVDEAKSKLDQALSLNHGLDAQFGAWPKHYLPESAAPFVVYAEYYKKTGDSKNERKYIDLAQKLFEALYEKTKKI